MHGINDNHHMLSDLEIKKKIKENNIKTIYLQFVDIHGHIKTLAMPSNQIETILNGEIMFDGSGFKRLMANYTPLEIINEE